MTQLADRLRRMRILAVDDVAVNVGMLGRILAQDGYTNVETTTSPIAALETCLRRDPDVFLLDLHMPEMSGFEVLDALGPSIHAGTGPVVLVLTGDITLEARRRALEAGARDIVSKPFDFDEVLLRVRNHLETRYFRRELNEQNRRLEDAVRLRTRELEASRVEVLDRLALVAEYRDDETNRHARRIGRVSRMLAEGLGMASPTLELLEQAAGLHDVGKIAISDTILRKPGPLTTEEHERWDGSGYPRGLAWAAIPPRAGWSRSRTSSTRSRTSGATRPGAPPTPPTPPPRSPRGAGTQFDPAVVEVFARHEPASLVDPVDADA